MGHPNVAVMVNHMLVDIANAKLKDFIDLGSSLEHSINFHEYVECGKPLLSWLRRILLYRAICLGNVPVCSAAVVANILVRER